MLTMWVELGCDIGSERGIEDTKTRDEGCRRGLKGDREAIGSDCVIISCGGRVKDELLTFDHSTSSS